ncbi:hypothetical protein VTO42DRAFT_8150 [Malbranchea cinnamomea]
MQHSTDRLMKEAGYRSGRPPASVADFRSHTPLNTTSDVGIFKSTILPSFALHSGLSVAAYVASRATDRAELKDWAWPFSQVLNAWWSAVGRHMYHDKASFAGAWDTLTWSEKLLLSGVTVWGTRLFYRIVSRSISRGKDDPRYTEMKAKEPQSFWDWSSAFLKLYFPEAVFLTFITLPFTLPFRLAPNSTVAMDPDVASIMRTLGVGLFGAGFGMEVLADSQLESHRQRCGDLCRHGVWSVVRHPNYLGDAIVHFSFFLLNVANSFHPLVILGPLTNYVYLRFFGGDKENEASQEARYKLTNTEKYQQLQDWRQEKNSFWPSLSELTNPWTWAVVGSGVVGVVLEKVVRSHFA